MSRCPVCNHPNPEGHNYCSECGAILDNITLATQIPSGSDKIPVVSQEIQDLVGLNEDLTYFGKDSLVILLAHSHPVPLEFGIPLSTGVILGRLSSRLIEKPLIDTTVLGGFKLGVSRYHAELIVRGQSLRIQDLDSTNGTFVNGVRVRPRELRSLSNGDTLQLGNLLLRLFFRHPD